MPPHSEEHTGARIAHVRKTRRLTQRELAALSNVSYSTVTKVEQGVMPPSPSVVGALARALSVPVSDLNGQPYFDELRQDQLDGLINPIREALNIYDLGPDPDVTPRALAALEEHADQLCAQVRATNIKQVATELPGLIHEATTAAHTSGSARSWQLLASTYRTAYDVTTKLGFPDLCTVALDRMDWAAQRASDPVLGACANTCAPWPTSGPATTRRASGWSASACPSWNRPNLGASLTSLPGNCIWEPPCSPAGTRTRTRPRSTSPSGASRSAPGLPKVHWLSFGPTNVGAHRVSVLAELDLYPDAVRQAEDMVIAGDWPPSRLAHHHAEVARAQMWTGQTEAAFKSLLKRASSPRSRPATTRPSARPMPVWTRRGAGCLILSATMVHGLACDTKTTIGPSYQ